MPHHQTPLNAPSCPFCQGRAGTQLSKIMKYDLAKDIIPQGKGEIKLNLMLRNSLHFCEDVIKFILQEVKKSFLNYKY